MTRETGRADLERDLARVTTDHRKLVDAIITGVPAEQVKDRMIDLVARRKELERQLAASPARDPLRIHPGMARTYRERIGQLVRGLAGADGRGQGGAAGLGGEDRAGAGRAGENPDGKSCDKPGLAIHLHGALASLLRLACGLPVHEIASAAPQMQKAPRIAGRGGAINGQSMEVDSQSIDIIGELVLVAGASNHLKLRLLSAYRSILEHSVLAKSSGLLRSAA
ncbi:hypothetical protein [Rhodobacter sp. SGA-6-6]|uniref:hypothetical protein n=1 Tax=Rhodobacter sp. SGA-6-6 TaxID=2710882 RepID=UPI001F0F802C|nr:hypothetical protein [Rhodobacter sp. SGA-6-6]